jgi:hypothetical protein
MGERREPSSPYEALLLSMEGVAQTGAVRRV